MLSLCESGCLRWTYIQWQHMQKTDVTLLELHSCGGWVRERVSRIRANDRVREGTSISGICRERWKWPFITVCLVRRTFNVKVLSHTVKQEKWFSNVLIRVGAVYRGMKSQLWCRVSQPLILLVWDILWSFSFSFEMLVWYTNMAPAMAKPIHPIVQTF